MSKKIAAIPKALDIIGLPSLKITCNYKILTGEKNFF